jgi:hypothetical protein
VKTKATLADTDLSLCREARRRITPRDGGQCAKQLLPIAGHEGAALTQVRTTGSKREGHVTQRQLRFRLSMLRVTGGERSHGGRRLARDRDQLRRGVGRHVRRDECRGRLLDDQVRVGAGEAERTHTRAPRTRSARPWGECRRHRQRHLRPVDARIQLLEVQVWRDGLVLQRQHHLQQPCHA